MKKYKIAICCAAFALGTLGLAACGNNTKNDGKHEKPDGSEPKSYTVVFETWGSEPVSKTVQEGALVEKPNDPVRTGWTFDGWYSGDTEYTFTEEVTGDLTLTAKYTSVLGGAGTVGSPFTIDNAAELALVKQYIDANATEFVSAVYVQTADITSTLTAPIVKFSGTYDGGGFTVTTSAPLFDSLAGTVRRLGVAGTVTNGGDIAGMVANTATRNARISNVSVSGSISATGVVGGIVGKLDGGRIELSASDASVSGGTAGGIAGESSGAVVNSVAQPTVTGTANAGGAVGALTSGGLIQNVGAGVAAKAEGAFVRSDAGNAGGIVGAKSAGSAIYRAFVYGNAVKGKNVGGIAGKLDGDGVFYTDVTNSVVLNTVEVTGSAATVGTVGEVRADDFSGLDLPEYYWTVSGKVPTLSAEPTQAPSILKIKIDGKETPVAYGDHVNDEELFGDDDLHFSQLVEVDSEVELKTVEQVHDTFEGWSFTAANDKLKFAGGGATVNFGKADTKLTYVLTYAYTDSFSYLPDVNDPSSAYDVDYLAPVSVYTDGKNYYAFVVTKQQVSSSNYIAYMDMYEKKDGKWAHADEWLPASNLPAGAYKYTVPRPFMSPLVYTVIVDGEYKTDDDGGYYTTRFLLRRDNDGVFIDDEPVLGRGRTVISLGDRETNAPTVAFSFHVDKEGYSDFVYYDKTGKLVNSIGLEVTDATRDFLGGTWYDGSKKYTFDTEAGTVTVGGNTVPFSVDNGKIKFTSGENYELIMAPSQSGGCKLIKTDGTQFCMTSYVGAALDGKWITENGDIIEVKCGAEATVSFNNVSAEANEALYNDRQAVRFIVGSAEYHLTVNAERGVAELITDSGRVFAFDMTVISEDFSGSFASVADGVKYALTVTNGVDFSLTVGAAEAVGGKALPVKTDDGYALAVTVGGDNYTVERVHDVLIATCGDVATVFADSDMFARFVGEFVNGVEALVVTENGTFARYARDGEAETYTELTAKYREERYEYGQEERGFVLSYTVVDEKDNETEYFFYADADAQNVRLYRAWINTAGNDTVTLVTNFVPESELDGIVGRYSRKYNNTTDTLEFTADGALTRTYTDSEGNVHNAEPIVWYPVLNYNTNTQNSTLMAYTHEIKEGGTGFTTSLYFTQAGLTWGSNDYIAEGGAAEAIPAYESLMYVTADSKAYITLTTSQLKLKTVVEESGSFTETSTTYYYDGIVAEENGSITIGMSNRDGSATAVLSTDGTARTVALTTGDTTRIFAGETPLDYNTLVGSYVYDSDTYDFVVDDSWMGTTIQLKISSARRPYSYSTSNGITIMSDGSRALMMTDYNNYQDPKKYVWKVGDALKVSNSLDASAAITAEDAAIAGMPTLDQIKTLLDGNTYTAADGSSISFAIITGKFASFEITDGDNSTYISNSGHVRNKGYWTILFGVGDPMAEIERYVNVYVNSEGTITKLLVGETAETATKEYLPAVSYPTVDELLATLKDMSYKSADGAVVSFSEMWGTYSITINDTPYDYVKNSGSRDGNVYTMEFKPTLGSAKKTVTVTYGADGVEKVNVDSKDYLPIAPPEMDELKTILDGAVFVDGNGKWILFENSTGYFASFNMELHDGDTDSGYGAFKSHTVNGKVYTLTFDNPLGDDIIAEIAFDAMGQVQSVKVGGVTYTALPAAEALLSGMDGAAFVNAEQKEIEFTVSPNYFGGSDTYSVTIDGVEYDFTDGSNDRFVYTLNYESSENGDTVVLTVTVGYDGAVAKVTANNIDYTPKSA